jgi:rfaE bifunctional protein nucleotidyltransferase chain/domain
MDQNLPSRSKIVSNQADALEIIQGWKNHGSSIVFTNGCFDILHAGHVTYLEQARQLGSHLIVAVNSDASVTALKGRHRPINSLVYRQIVLAALESVSMVLDFNDDTPERWIEAIMPDWLVKGGDWQADTMPGAKFVKSYGGQVKTIDLVEGLSTTNIEAKLKKLGN